MSQRGPQKSTSKQKLQGSAGVPGSDDQLYTSVIDGLKHLYRQKMKPLEELYKFGDFHSPVLTDADIEAKPMVLLLGQYSTGKTTFIRYLLERDFPGQNIGPEPTTDRFNAVMWSSEERVIPGNTVAVQEDKPFRGLSKFGTGFLSKFQCSTLPAPLLEKISFIDTPGVLSGEKQRIGRSYDFPQICEWFAERSDLILLLFDAHKLDISDEFRSAIESLRGHDDKIRIVLNKADKINGQQLLRVYGALMWSLGRVMRNPEVMRVYLGSFWDQPLQNEDTKKLLEAEMKDLMTDLQSLPRNSAMRRLNDLVKRARLAKVHAHIIGHLRNEMPLLIGKDSKQAELIANLPTEFKKVHKNGMLPAGDFPDIEKFREHLKLYDFAKFAKLNQKMLDTLDEVLLVDFPKLMQAFPMDARSKPTALEMNPFAAEEDPNFWQQFDSVDVPRHTQHFREVCMATGTGDNKISGQAAKPVLQQTGLPTEILSKIWKLSDIDKDGRLDLEEFMMAMHLSEQVREKGIILPDTLPASLVPPNKKVTL
eukprot:Phypoly_transcript_06523.p1 GENE.Phypoly_transcript_06523~~Phypoly_transcript_06523.p1  ORF type:complete len:536 (+),score=79.39 Phypoly_transcript_06523:108-1715(+)